jgi:hypothetical protein
MILLSFLFINRVNRPAGTNGPVSNICVNLRIIP